MACKKRLVSLWAYTKKVLSITSYYPRSSTDTRDSYNLTLSFVVFRVVQGSSVQVVVFNSSYYRRFLIKMQGGYHDTFYLIVQ